MFSFPFLLLCLGQTYFQYLFFYQGLQLSGAALGALLTSIGSFWWMILAPLFLKSKWPEAKNWIGLLISIVGISISLFSPGAGSNNLELGVLFFGLTSLCGAFGTLAIKPLSRIIEPRFMTAASLFIGGILLTVTALFFELELDNFYKTSFLFILFYLAIISATGFTIWNQLIEEFSIHRMAAYRFLIPLCGVIESALFIPDESIGIGIVVGGTCILFSLRFCAPKN